MPILESWQREELDSSISNGIDEAMQGQSHWCGLLGNFLEVARN